MTTAPVRTRVEPAAALAALGHEARLAIFRILVRSGDAGLPIHQIQGRLGGMPRSTLAHHLSMLAQAGLVSQRKVAAEVVTSADYAAMRELVTYLTDECCLDTTAAGGPECGPADGGGCEAGEGVDLHE
jgi:ArsR family transcriptional regulator, arsenate/arsenite/antimonite-responsive transcriptional repressor